MALKGEHGTNPEAPIGLGALLQRLIGMLEVHMNKEELILFPAIRRGGGPGLENPIAVMRADHEVAQFCRLSHDLTLPERRLPILDRALGRAGSFPARSIDSYPTVSPA